MLTWYRNVKTSVKLLTVFVALALIVMAVGMLGLSRMTLMHGYLDTIYRDSLVMAIDLGHVNEDASAIRLNALKMVSGMYNDNLQDLFSQSNDLAKKVDALLTGYVNDAGLTANEKKEIGSLVDAWKAYNESRTNTMQWALEKDFEKARANARSDAGKKYDLFDDRLESFIKVQSDDGKDLFEKASAAKESATRIIWLGVLFSMAAAVAIGLFITALIANPLKEMSAAAERIAEGDLNVEIKAQTRDEIGSLAGSFRAMIVYLKGMAVTAEAIAQGDLRGEVTPKSDRDVLGNSFHQMVAGLRSIVTEIRGGADQMASASGQIASTSEQTARNNESAATAVEETTSTMHEMSANIQNVAKSAQNQAASVTQTSASIEEMVASIQRIADTVTQFVQLSNKTKKAVEQGLDTVAKSVKGTDEISRSIMRSSDTISALGARVEDIGKIVDVIDEIAEQTNLLALNAAIEAARAGEQGQGFAVVADEVRKLAERSAKSTKEIAELISGIQREAQDAVKVMEKSTQLVERGVELSGEVGNTLKAIESNVVEVDRYSQEIGAATQEQSSGSAEIGKAAENLREVTHEISSATDEQASAAEQIVRTMEKMREMIHQNAAATTELASSAEELRSQAERFQDIIGRFSLDDEDKAGRHPVRKKELAHHVGNGGDKSKDQRRMIGVA